MLGPRCSPRSHAGGTQTADDLLLNPRRHDDPTRFGQTFEPSGHIHPVAENVAVLDDDVALMDTDAELDASVRRVPLGNPLLHSNGATHTASITLANSTSMPSPVFFTVRPRCSWSSGPTTSRRLPLTL